MSDLKIIPLTQPHQKRKGPSWVLGFLMPLLAFFKIFSTLRGPAKAAAFLSVGLGVCGVFLVGAAASGGLQPKKVYAYNIVKPLPDPVPSVFEPRSAAQPVEEEAKPVTKDRRRPEPAPVEEPNADRAQKYINRYASLAQKIWKQYKIPASITLAQGIIESRSGTSKLAVQNNNHFGIKCFSKNCRKGHCSNHTDDTHKDFFMKFSSAEECFKYRATHVLSKGRYSKLRKYGNDYERWAYGLKSAGYATDPNYARTLISTIQRYNLSKFD
jgi:hypothetical protein